MKLCRFDDDRLGLVIGDTVHDVSPAQEEIRRRYPYAMQGDAVIAALGEWRSRLEEMAKRAPRKPVAEVKLLAPVARPSKVMAAPTNYAKHIAEMAARRDHKPPKISSNIGEAGIFLKANSALVGASEGIPVRFPERRTEHEIELVVVIGKAGTDIPAARAMEHVAGYTMGLDMTVRGPEDRSFRKSLDGYAPVGPWLVTSEEIADPDDLRLTLHVNGELRQTADTREHIYKVARLIEFASSFYTLHPGDLLFTGSPAGVAPVKAGDVIRAHSNAIGSMEISVRAHGPA
ncbi:MAG TPA: fumarylacetoacetate hydrolase family protein [Hyphomicrobiaceae bacterium]|nr:fumarylacetoacetate hydrolase family protein [Hyphomicrobiaceae bacterium]